MDKREQIQEEINNIASSMYGRNTDAVLQKLIKQRKKVYQYTLDGELIGVYEGVVECAKKNNLGSASHITSSIKRKRPYNGFLFCYEGETIQIRDKVNPGPKPKPFSLLTKSGDHLINAYSYKDVTDYLGLELTKNERGKLSKAYTGLTKTYRNEYIIKPLD